MSIPKSIFLTWKTKDIADNQSPIILNGLRNLIDLNPDWNVTVYDDHEVDYYLQQNLSYRDYLLYSNTHIVEKSDIWRLFKLYYEGGAYIDLDRYCNIPFNQIIDDNVKCVLPTCLDHDFSQDFMMSEPGNPIYARAIELILQRRREGHTSVYFLGPQTYMHAVTEVLIGNIIDTNPGVQTFNDIRRVIADAYPFIKTYREHPPHDTVLYKHDPLSFKMGNSESDDWATQKYAFYASCGLKHWTDSLTTV